MASLEYPVAKLKALSEEEKAELSVVGEPELWHLFFRPPLAGETGMQPTYSVMLRDKAEVAIHDHPKITPDIVGRIAWKLKNGKVVEKTPMTEDSQIDVRALSAEVQKSRKDKTQPTPNVEAKDVVVGEGESMLDKVVEANGSPADLRVATCPDVVLKPKGVEKEVVEKEVEVIR